MLLATLNGFEFHLPTSGGKAGRGNQKTSNIQVRKDGMIVKQFSFIVNSSESRSSAVQKARQFAERS